MASSNLSRFNSVLADIKTQSYLQTVLGEKRSSFVNNITSLVTNQKKLQACEPLSLLYAGIKATALNLPLDNNLGFAYVIPYKTTREVITKEGRRIKEEIQEGQFQIGYKGFIQLAIRTGLFKTMNVTDIREGELMDFDILTGNIAFKAVENRERYKVIGYLAYFRLINGFEKMFYSPTEKVIQHAEKYSKALANDFKNESLWKTNFDSMACKTVLKHLLSTYAPLSVEMQEAISSDQAVITESGKKYIDSYSDEDPIQLEDNSTEPLPEHTDANTVTVNTPEAVTVTTSAPESVETKKPKSKVDEAMQQSIKM